jgi:ribonuclease Y
MITPLLIVVFFLIWWVAWYFITSYHTAQQLTKKKNTLVRDIEALQTQAKDILRDADQKAQKTLERTEKEIETKQKKLDHIEERLLQKEEKIDQRIDLLDKKKEEILEKNIELEKTIAHQQKILSDISQLSPEEAKQQLFSQIEHEHTSEIKTFIHKFKMIKEEEAKDEAAKIIAKVLPRVASEWLSEHLVTMVDLPTEDMKGKIIGREGRNISQFEKVTGVEVTIDDTPLTIKLSSYDPEKRFIGAETMKKLVKDGRINPVYIEKYYEETCKEVHELYSKKWKEALAILNLPMMKPEIVELIWRFHLRYSYGQNLWIHSIEVAKIAEMLANELWLNADLAKKAWLLHDIGKIEAWSGEAHTKVWGEILRKYWMHEVIINTAEGHHFDVELTSPEAWVATAADTISASRPGARFDTKDLFIERMSGLENLISTIEWVQKVYIMQAWREIMTFVNPDTTDDLQLEALVKTIGQKIEDQLDYPGAIRIVGIRENKIVHHLK